MGTCSTCCRDPDDPLLQPLPPKRLGAVFSDIDGTLIHYPARLEQQGYERLADSDSPAVAGGHLARFRHKESGTIVHAHRVPTPGGVAPDAWISVETLQLVRRLKNEHDVDFVVMTGARNSTFLERCNAVPDALPAFDFGVSEGGGRIYEKGELREEKKKNAEEEQDKKKEEEEEPAAVTAETKEESAAATTSAAEDPTAAVVSPAAAEENEQQQQQSHAPRISAFAEPTASANHQDRLQLLEDWLDKFAPALGPWRDNESVEDPAQRTGILWDAVRHLCDNKKLLDAEIDESLAKVDGRSFVSSFLVSLVETEEHRVRREKREAVAAAATAAKVTVVDDDDDQTPQPSDGVQNDAAAASNPLTFQKQQQQQQSPTTTTTSVSSPNSSNATTGVTTTAQTRVTSDEIRLKILLREHFPSLSVYTNMSKAQVSAKGCTKAGALEFLCSQRLGIDVGANGSIRSVQAEIQHVNKTDYFPRKKELDSFDADLDHLIEEEEEKRMRVAHVEKSVISELEASNAKDSAKVAEAKEKYRAQLQEEFVPAIRAAAEKVDKSRDVLRGLKAFWMTPADGDEYGAVAAETEGAVEPDELPLQLLEVVETLSLMLRSTDAEEQQQEHQQQQQDSESFSSDDDKDSNNKDKKKQQQHRAWRGTLGCFNALVQASALVDEIRDFDPFAIVDSSDLRRRIFDSVDNGRAFVAVEPEEVERQERLKLLKMSGADDEEKQQQQNEFSLTMIEPLVEFCRAVAAFANAREKLQPKFDKIRAKEKDIRRRKRQIRQREEEISPLRARVAELQDMIAARRKEAKRLKMLVDEIKVKLDELESLLLMLKERQARERERYDELCALRESTNRRNAEQPRFAAALFDDENDLEFARLCDAGFAPCVSHPAVSEFLTANEKQRDADLKNKVLRRDRVAPFERCPVEGFLGTEYALKKLLEMAAEGDGLLRAWNEEQRSCCAKLCCS